MAVTGTPVAALTALISTDDAKAWLRVDIATDDDLIDALVLGSTAWAEDYQRRRFLNVTETQQFTSFPNVFVLERSKLVSVATITYIDIDGVERTIDTSVYDVFTDPEPGQVRLADGQVWPTPRGDFNGITVTYVAGYGANASDVPDATITGVKMLLHDSYEWRGNQTDMRVSASPAALRFLQMNRVLGADT